MEVGALVARSTLARLNAGDGAGAVALAEVVMTESPRLAKSSALPEAEDDDLRPRETGTGSAKVR